MAKTELKCKLMLLVERSWRSKGARGFFYTLIGRHVEVNRWFGDPESSNSGIFTREELRGFT